MRLRKWDNLPEFMKTNEVREYYCILERKQVSIIIKRLFDFILSLILLIFLAIPMIIIAIAIKKDSEGPIFYRQERVTMYGKKFRIHKFRTMVNNADKIGTNVTIQNDYRITKIGEKLRGCRLDELPQLFDVMCGNMSFVGTRPEVIKYVEKYTPEMYATFLLPAGITSEASIRYKDEADLLQSAEDVDYMYVEKVLPDKMRYNLKSIKEFGLLSDLKTMVRTILAVLGKKYN